MTGCWNSRGRWFPGGAGVTQPPEVALEMECAADDTVTRGRADWLEGKAVDEGLPAGGYATIDFTGGAPSGATAGSFTATAELTANFGGASVVEEERFCTSGRVTEFRDADDDGDPIGDWSVDMERIGLVAGTASFSGGATAAELGQSTGEGFWERAFFGNGPPTASRAPTPISQRPASPAPSAQITPPRTNEAYDQTGLASHSRRPPKFPDCESPFFRDGPQGGPTRPSGPITSPHSEPGPVPAPCLRVRFPVAASRGLRRAGVGRRGRAAAHRQPEPVPPYVRPSRLVRRARVAAGLVRGGGVDGRGVAPGRGPLRRGTGSDRRRDVQARPRLEARVRGRLGIPLRGVRRRPPRRGVRRVHRGLA